MKDRKTADKDNKEQLVARTSYFMDRGKLRKRLKWVKARKLTTEKEPEPRQKPAPVKPAVKPAARPGQKAVPVEPTGGEPRQKKTRQAEKKPRREGRSSPKTRVTMAVYTSDSAKRLNTLLDSLFAQKTTFNFRVVAVDRRSTDGTLDILRKRKVAIVSLLEGESFPDRAMEATDSEIVVFLNDRMLPIGPEWLGQLLLPFSNDEHVMLSSGRHMPGEDRSAWERAYLFCEPFLSGHKALYVSRENKPRRQIPASIFNSAVRRKLWSEQQFSDKRMADWAEELLQKGWVRTYVPRATVALLGGSLFGKVLNEAYGEGQKFDGGLGSLLRHSVGKTWKEWRRFHDSGLMENGKRGEAYWQSLVINLAPLAGKIESSKKTKKKFGRKK